MKRLEGTGVDIGQLNINPTQALAKFRFTIKEETLSARVRYVETRGYLDWSVSK